LAPIVDDVEVTSLIDTAIYYLVKYISKNARGDIQGLTLWLALVNVEHAILCLRLTDRAENTMSGSAYRASSHRERKEVRPRKQNSSDTYTIGKSIEEITLRLASVKTTSKDSAKLLSELRACRDILVKAIRRNSSIS
jgi:hypothetical protein